MADETNLSLLVGQLQGGFREVKQMLIDQNNQHVRDKEEAIKERDRRHEENRAELRNLSAAIDSTATIARDNKKWIDDEGRPLVGRVSNLEQARIAASIIGAGQEGEARGSAKTWAWIGAAITAAGGLLGAALTYRDQIVTFFRGH